MTSQVILTVVDRRDGTTSVVLLGRPDLPGLGVIGSDERCTVQLRDPSVAPQHVRCYGLANHFKIEVVADCALGDSAIVRRGDHELAPGEIHRVDVHPFTIGPFELTFGWSGS